MSEWKKSGVNEIYDTVMNLDGIDAVLNSLDEKQREQVINFFAGYSSELMGQLNETRVVASKMTDVKAQVNLVKQAGLNPLVLDIRCFSLKNALDLEIDGDSEQLSLKRIPSSLYPFAFSLLPAYPNPFNPVTTLRYDLPSDALVTLSIYDMLGKEITQLVNTNQQAGFKSVQWDATDSMGRPVSAGVYLYQIQAGEFVQTKKMVLLK